MSQESSQSSDLARLIEIATDTTSKVPVLQRLKAAGFTGADLDALALNPLASREIWSAAIRRFLIPIVPSLVLNLAKRAESGDAKAQELAIKLLGSDSPVAEAAGRDLSSLPDDALAHLAGQLQEQLAMVSKK